MENYDNSNIICLCLISSVFINILNVYKIVSQLIALLSQQSKSLNNKHHLPNFLAQNKLFARNYCNCNMNTFNILRSVRESYENKDNKQIF